MSSTRTISRQDIINAAFKIVRESGWQKFSARNIARALKCSTMPIYYQFKSMIELEEEVVGKAMAILGEYESKPYTDTLALNHGIGYVLFAWEEPYLFEAINDKEHVSMQVKIGDRQFDMHVDELSRNFRMQGLSDDQLREFQFLAWIFAHGIASIKNWVDEKKNNFKREDLIELIRLGSKTLTTGYMINHRPDSMSKKRRRRNS